MKRYKLIDLSSNVITNYIGKEVSPLRYFFTDENGSETAIEVTDLKNGKMLLLRKADNIILRGELEVNRVAELHIDMVDNSFSGSLPVLVRELTNNFPHEIKICYQILDEKNVPIETCDILIAEVE